jgi:hypothetical protein
MSVRVQVILGEREAARFRSQARRECKSLSEWLRNAGNMALEAKRSSAPPGDPASLAAFFRDCDARELVREPGWEAHKRLILEGHGSAERP